MASFLETEVLSAMEAGTGEWTNVQSPVRRMLVMMSKAIDNASRASRTTKNSAMSDLGNKGAIWKELAAMREDLSTRATRVEVHESLQLKADRSSVYKMRMEGEGSKVNMLRNLMEEQREVHFRKHDALMRAELEAVNEQVKRLGDRFQATQFENRFEGLEMRVTEFGKRRRLSEDKLSKLVADVQALGSQVTESSSLYLRGIVRLRETLDRLSIKLSHKANKADIRKELAAKVDQSEHDTLRNIFSAKSLQNKFDSLERKISDMNSKGQLKEKSFAHLKQSLEVLSSEVQYNKKAIDKELGRLTSEVDVVQEQNKQLHHSEASLQAESERNSTQLSRRLTQVEEILERYKPRLHDLSRQMDRTTKHQDLMNDKLEGVSRSHKQLSSTQVATLVRDTERLKKTLIHLERREAAAGSTDGTSATHHHSFMSNNNSQKIETLTEQLRELKSSTIESENRLDDFDGYLKEVQFQIKQQHQKTTEALDKAAEERVAIKNRCGALEVGVRHSLSVLSRPPSVKSNSSSIRNHHRRRHHHRHHHHHDNQEKGETRVHDRDIDSENEENLDAASDSGNRSLLRRKHNTGRRSRHSSKAGSRKSRRSSRRSRHNVDDDLHTYDRPRGSSEAECEVLD